LAITYEDLDDQKLGRETRIANLADQKIAEVADQAELEAQEAELANMAEAEVDAKMLQEAQAIIDEMDRVYAQGGDPQQVLNKVPEELAQVVVQLLEQEIMEYEQNNQNTEQEVVGQQDLSLDGSNETITDKARRIASLI